MSGLIKDLMPAVRGGSVGCVLTQEGRTEAPFRSKLGEDPSTQTMPFCCGYLFKVFADLQRN